MKVSKRDMLLLIGFLGILAAVCAYLFVFQPAMEKADALEQENRQLQTRITDLSLKMAQKDTYVSDTESMRQETDAIYQRFPVDVREEDSILLAVNQELISPMLIDSVSISALQAAALPDLDEEDVDHTYEIEEVEEYEAQEGISDDTSAASDTQADGTDTASVDFVLMERNVTISYLVSYDGLKRAIKNISAQDNRMSIDNLTVSYDESTGLLSGMTSVDMYCIPGQPDKEYVQPSFSSVLLGTENIFGSIELYGERAYADVEEEAAEDEDEEEDGE